MNLNLVNLSKIIKTEYIGQFDKIATRTINNLGGTNIDGKMLDLEKNMENEKFIERLKYILGTNSTDYIGEIAKDTGVSIDKVQNIISGLINAPIEFSKEGGNCMRESFQIGDKIEINNSGDGLTNNYSGLLNNSGIIKALKVKISDLEKLLKEKDALMKEKDALIAAQRETIELLKKGS